MERGNLGAAPGGRDVVEALRVWRDGLINITGTNRALNFRHTQTGTVPIASPSVRDIFEGLRDGRTLSFLGLPDVAVAQDMLSDDATPRALPGRRTLGCAKGQKDLSATLRNLQRREQQEYLDRGLAVMYVALGMLRWKDVDDTAYTSPLLLVPVKFVSMGRKNDPRLKASGDDDPTVNPALALRLHELGVTLPEVDDLTDLSIQSLLDQVRVAVADKKAWTVTDEAVLSAFSFMKEAMYRDLLTNEVAIAANPMVAALANQDPTTQGGGLLFDEIEPEDIDRDAPAEYTPLILDADSSQRACVAAAVAGRSFVMDGPPGTGKSQTIANMIGALLHAGKTVLFVSEKAAALEVVRNRLAHVGLDNYLLELHSHKASRKEVAAQLAAALDKMPVAPPGMRAAERAQIVEKRDRLNAYASAMNSLREPLNRTFHDVLGAIAALDHLPAAPTPLFPGANLSQELLSEIDDAASRLQRAWRPALQGRSFLWRQVTDQSRLDARLYSAEAALEELNGTAAHNHGIREAFGLNTLGGVEVLASLLDLTARRPAGIPDHWLTATDFAGVETTKEDLAAALITSEVASERATALAGVPWTNLPEAATLPALPTLASLTPTPVALEDLTSAEAQEIHARFAGDASMLDDRIAALAALTTTLNLPPAHSIHEVDSLFAMLDAAFAPHRPLRSWLTPEGVRLAHDAAAMLRSLASELARAEFAARRVYTNEALKQPLAELHQRFTTVHRGLRKLLGDYRRDKKTVAAFTAEMVNLDTAIRDLGLAVAWAQAQNAYAEAEPTISAVLGPYWRGRETDLDAVTEALAVADDLLHRTPDPLLPAVTDFVTGPPEPAVKAVMEQTRNDLGRWRSSLAPAPAHTARPDLLLGSLSTASAWLRSHLEPLASVFTITRAFSEATGRDTTLRDAQDLRAARQSAADALATLTQRAPHFEAMLGPTLHVGVRTDIQALGAAIAWAKSLRGASRGRDIPLTPEQVKSLATARQTEHLRPAVAAWRAAADAVVGAFDPARHSELAGELDDPVNAASLLRDLRADTAGQGEWLSYTQARADLVSHGLTHVVRFCTDQGVPVEQVGRVFHRAVLSSFADAVFKVDDALQPLRAQDRDALVEQFRQLDRRLIPAATSDIIRAVNTRRPAAVDVGEPALIRREGVKKTRHRPVRELIASTRGTTLAIKPCFMMSPLSVSQYLPADMRFDVVIFDEASQVTPGDAVNCIYRGNALITAGDDRQLPPTSFFDRVADDEGETETDVNDFQSILELAKASGGFRNLGLRWHYRSRHEALIAFSNQKFYDGKLITYPGAHSDSPDVGVELIHVPGTYRRGTSRDNPIEAEHVAQRVLHHFDTRPDTSLGVVTFSVAQADAIQVALDRALDERPDLSSRLDGDRLTGFFIKSLESVQGDERDVMIFSIGYGRDENGKITSNFGALNQAKGWRRLNVAITRARQRVEIVATIRAGDIPDSPNESVRHLTAYLDYAERGTSALALELGSAGMGPESPFEDSVIDAIRAMGFTVEPQVGAAGYRIDIGVRHPAHPGVFALGVECDGYMYHSSRAARDRDRLRQQVLEGLGWRLHRIWGTAWYRNREAATASLRGAIEAAVNAPVVGRLSGSVDPFERTEIELADVDQPATPTWVTPYRIASVPRLPRWIDPSEQGARWDMVTAIEVLARDEGPVHVDLVYQRLRDAWSIGRIGPRIQENIHRAIGQANVTFEDDFLDVPNRSSTAVRVPENGVGHRNAGHVPEVEIEGAFNNLLNDAGAVKMEDLFISTARTFGWNRRGQDISSRMDRVLRRMRERGEVAVHGDMVSRQAMD